MLFNVRVVSADDYDAYLQHLQDSGAGTDAPILGGENASTQRPRDSPRRGRSDRHDGTLTSRHRSAQAAGPAARHDPHHHRPQADRQALPRYVVRVVPGRRPDGHADPLRARLPGHADRQRRALQPALHDARHDHAAALRDAAVLRLRQRDHAAADRLARRRVPAAEHVQLLALPLRRPDRRLRLPDPAGRGRLRLVRLHAALRRRPVAGRRW